MTAPRLSSSLLESFSVLYGERLLAYVLLSFPTVLKTISVLIGLLQKGTRLYLTAFDRQWDFAQIELGEPRHFDAGASGNIFVATMSHAMSESTRDSTSVRVALKVFPCGLSATKRELLRRELRASRSMDHQYIIPFLGTATHNLQTIIVLPYMKNGNLLQYLTCRAKLGFKGRIDCPRLIGQVAAALDYLHHTAGFVHGDLKCQNVLVSDKGDALLADFGLATAIEKEEEERPTSASIRRMSTLRFCAPELFWLDDLRLGYRSKTQATDVYALGMLILEACTLAPPWDGLNDRRVMLHLAKQQIPERPLNVPALNDFLWSICRRCWSIDPAKRPSTVHISRALELNTHLTNPVGTGPFLLRVPHDVLELMFTMEWKAWGFPLEFKDRAGSLMLTQRELVRALRNAQKQARSSGSVRLQWTEKESQQDANRDRLRATTTACSPTKVPDDSPFQPFVSRQRARRTEAKHPGHNLLVLRHRFQLSTHG
ncbi:kinase-like protein [Exidia glandulosa HHB12029]|uniref:Kinase-like protein n=1 Tax=Exidia glandulosa HHB12029 TaxID=1314781 RepID=A0A165G698_EXIGL|nr:kinase-like protein [Exidia glandulosa HHB12029]